MDTEKSYDDNADKYVAFTTHNTYRPLTRYIQKWVIENIKTREIPAEDDYMNGYGAAYYVDTNGTYGGTTCTTYLLKAKEIQNLLASDPAFVLKAIAANKTWFLPKNLDIFLF